MILVTALPAGAHGSKGGSEAVYHEIAAQYIAIRDERDAAIAQLAAERERADRAEAWVERFKHIIINNCFPYECPVKDYVKRAPCGHRGTTSDEMCRPCIRAWLERGE